MPRLQPTLNGLDPYACVSAVQKCFRRGMERRAMEFVVEMSRTSKHYFSWACNRIEICAHEDIGLADREAVMFASQAIDQARRFLTICSGGVSFSSFGHRMVSLARRGPLRPS